MQSFQENRDHADLRCEFSAAQSVERVVRIESALRKPSYKVQIMSGTLQTRVMVINDRERLAGILNLPPPRCVHSSFKTIPGFRMACAETQYLLE